MRGDLAAHADVRAAGTSPLDHFDGYGYREGRDPASGLDSSAYLAAYRDAGSAGVDPLQHYLQYGIYQGRSAFADTTFGAGLLGCGARG